MAKKVIKLTLMELSEIIKDSVLQVMDKTEGAEYLRVYNETHKKIDRNESPIDLQTISGLKDAISQDTFLKEYIGKTFKFYGRSPMGLPTIVLLSFKRIVRLNQKQAVLSGTVIYNESLIEDDKIIINYAKSKVQYRVGGNGHIEDLEIDNRFKEQWGNLCEQLQKAIKVQYE